MSGICIGQVCRKAIEQNHADHNLRTSVIILLLLTFLLIGFALSLLIMRKSNTMQRKIEMRLFKDDKESEIEIRNDPECIDF